MDLSGQKPIGSEFQVESEINLSLSFRADLRGSKVQVSGPAIVSFK